MRPSATILVAALVTEGLLVVVSYIAIGLWDLEMAWGAATLACGIGVLAAIPPLALNEYLWRRSQSDPSSVYARFSREVVVPLCRQVNAPIALALALMSGFGEELFFRGVLHQLVYAAAGAPMAALVTSLLFAYVHFIGQTQRFGGMLPLYILMGFYLWTVNEMTQSLTAVMTAHATYNFVAIQITRRRLDHSKARATAE